MTPLHAAIIAESAYADAPSIGVPSGAARAVVYGDVVAFPGTDNIETFLADLDALAEDAPGFGRVHSGFYRTYSDMAGALARLEGINVCVGHSLGAALAILHAAELCLAGKPPKQVWAFEPPHVSADSKIYDLLQSHKVETHLYRNGNDIVTQVPCLLEKWRHPGPLTAIGIPTWPFDNIEDHKIAAVKSALTT
jgi:triacylglycerol lipase